MLMAHLNKHNFIAIILLLFSALSSSVGADDFVLLGEGVCRTAITTDKKIYSYNSYSWGKCRELCTSTNCSGIEFNILNDHSVCELHYAPVRLKPTKTNDRVHSCWARTEESIIPGSFAAVIDNQKINCTDLNDSTAICDCDHEPNAEHAAACKIVLDANCSYNLYDNVWTCPIDPQ
jgi:hypothetical protein